MFPLWAYHPAAAGLQGPPLQWPLCQRHVRPAARRLGPAQDLRDRKGNPTHADALFRSTASTMAQLKAAADSAGRAIPPVWPLASSVAVNPWLGQSGQTLAETAALLARTAGTAGDHAAQLVPRTAGQRCDHRGRSSRRTCSLAAYGKAIIACGSDRRHGPRSGTGEAECRPPPIWLQRLRASIGQASLPNALAPGLAGISIRARRCGPHPAARVPMPPGKRWRRMISRPKSQGFPASAHSWRMRRNGPERHWPARSRRSISRLQASKPISIAC